MAEREPDPSSGPSANPGANPGANRQEVRVPDVGEAEDVEVIEILVGKGDRVEVEDPIVTLESDKATMELPSPMAGIVESVAVSVGDTVTEGSLLLVLEVAEGATAAAPESASTATSRPAPAEPPPSPPASVAAPHPGAPAQGAMVRRPPPIERSAEPPTTPPHASPLVRRVARELGVELSGAQGSGPGGRILDEDVKATVRAVMSGGAAARAAAGVAKLPDFSRYGEIEEVGLSKVRRVSARNLAQSWREIPHVTQHDDVDLTALEAFRKDVAPRLKAEGVRISPLLFVMKACAIALRAFPNVRSSLVPGGDGLIVKHYYHLGIAVDTENGLVVPVVRDVDRKGLRELALEVADLAGKARERKLQPSDFEGAVFSISSLGGIGGTAFTPIVNGPQVAILGLSRTTVKPVWDGEQFAPRQILPVSLSYDHRVVDGAEAVRFTTELVRLLSDPAHLLI